MPFCRNFQKETLWGTEQGLLGAGGSPGPALSFQRPWLRSHQSVPPRRCTGAQSLLPGLPVGAMHTCASSDGGRLAQEAVLVNASGAPRPCSRVSGCGLCFPPLGCHLVSKSQLWSRRRWESWTCSNSGRMSVGLEAALLLSLGYSRQLFPAETRRIRTI